MSLSDIILANYPASVPNKYINAWMCFIFFCLCIILKLPLYKNTITVVLTLMSCGGNLMSFSTVNKMQNDASCICIRLDRHEDCHCIPNGINPPLKDNLGVA